MPDYQREYVWKVDDQVEQFLADIEGEYEPDAAAAIAGQIAGFHYAQLGIPLEWLENQQWLKKLGHLPTSLLWIRETQTTFSK